MNVTKLTLTITLCAALLGSPVGAQPQATYATPEEAAQALQAALGSQGDQAMLQVLGPEAKDLLHSGDAVRDAQGRASLVKAFESMSSLGTDSPAKRTLYLGTERYPFPISLVKRADDRWAWNTHDGKEEIIARRIGRDELTAAEVLQAIAQAQREYALQDRQGDGLCQYAQKLLSDPGTHNGLHWDSQDGLPSPLASLVAKAESQGYHPGSHQGYFGYHFHLLTRQGPKAPGGAYSYLINGHQVAGFAAIAWPMAWNETGVMTLMIGPSGVIYQKNLGPDSATLGPQIDSFDPGPGWSKLK